MKKVLYISNFASVLILATVLLFSSARGDVINLPELQAKKIDCFVNAYLRKSPSMGFSIAIAHLGNPVFMKGYGWANKGQVPATENTIYRTASIAKGVTGVLALLLEQERLIDLKAKAKSSDYLPELPGHHKNYTLEDLLTNRSKVRHYCCRKCKQKDVYKRPVCTGKDPVSRAENIESAWSAVKLFMNDRLVHRKYHYSTHAYTIFAAAIEAKVGAGFCNLVERYISNPYQINTLRCENRKVPNKDRAAIYRLTRKKRLVPAKADNLSWKYAGGGMEVSVKDLMAFGVKLRSQEILNDKRLLTRLFTAPDKIANYGLGWNFKQNSRGYSYFAKSGEQRGAKSYLRVYRDKDLIIAAMRNTYGRDFKTVSDKIAQIILHPEQVKPGLKANRVSRGRHCAFLR